MPHSPIGLATEPGENPTLAKLRVEYWPVERLKPYERNPRKNDKAVEQIRASIREFGFAVPVLAKSDGEVIDGHLRLKGAIAESMREVPVVPCDGWTAGESLPADGEPLRELGGLGSGSFGTGVWGTEGFGLRPESDGLRPARDRRLHADARPNRGRSTARP